MWCHNEMTPSRIKEFFKSPCFFDPNGRFNSNLKLCQCRLLTSAVLSMFEEKQIVKIKQKSFFWYFNLALFNRTFYSTSSLIKILISLVDFAIYLRNKALIINKG